MASRTALFLKTAVFAITLSFSQFSFAQVFAHRSYLSAVSTDPRLASVTSQSSASKSESAIDSATSINISREQGRLSNYMKDLGIPEQQYEYKSRKKFYYHLANAFARLRLYPLAMKCFFKAVRANAEIDSLSLSADSIRDLQSGSLELSSRDDSVVGTKALALKNKKKDKKSRRTSFHQIAGNFNDGKKAVAYALLFHVKQPAPGKRKIFVWVNTGHTFITLIKYNSDSTYASASFGFYPDKDQMLSATPIAPTTSATFKDDAGHLWDEVLGKFISKRNFENILELTQKFEGMTYNLNKQNCTDFGLQAASLAGIHIADTSGKWPLGRGNNPAVTGQSILKGMVKNGDNTHTREIFVDQTVSDQHAYLHFDY